MSFVQILILRHPLVDWTALSIGLDGAFPNGQTALEYLEENPVDIVITDIKMPVMDGIQLLNVCRGKGIRAKFVLLTGYGEFSYAQSAMQYGVQHYLLKPTDEVQISQALTEIVQDLKKEQQALKKMEEISNQLSRLRPSASSGFLQNYLLLGDCSESDYQFFAKELMPRRNKCRLVLLQPVGEAGYLLHFSIQNICEEIFSDYGDFCTATVLNCTAVLSTIDEDAKAQECAAYIKQKFEEYFSLSLHICFSPLCLFAEIPPAYQTCRRTLLFCASQLENKPIFLNDIQTFRMT